jgi:hypothetical protein
MASSIDSSGFDTDAFNRGTDPVLNMITPEQAEQIAKYRGDDVLRLRIDELAEKSSAGTLSVAERAEYEGYVQANKFVAVLQAKARKLLKDAGSQ